MTRDGLLRGGGGKGNELERTFLVMPSMSSRNIGISSNSPQGYVPELVQPGAMDV